MSLYCTVELISPYEAGSGQDWYWWANLGVSIWGPLPGIWVGAKLGQELKRVRD